MFLKYFLSFFLLLSTVLDFFTFYFHKSFYSLESNPIFIISNSLILLFIIKFGLSALLIYYIFIGIDKHIKNDNLSKFIWINIIILLTILQFFGAYSNINAKKFIQESTGIEDISKISTETVQKYSLDYSKRMIEYFKIIFIAYLYPFLISCITFFVYENWDRRRI